jgi:hypothetical protein
MSPPLPKQLASMVFSALLVYPASAIPVSWKDAVRRNLDSVTYLLHWVTVAYKSFLSAYFTCVMKIIPSAVKRDEIKLGNIIKDFILTGRNTIN